MELHVEPVVKDEERSPTTVKSTSGLVPEETAGTQPEVQQSSWTRLKRAVLPLHSKSLHQFSIHPIMFRSINYSIDDLIKRVYKTTMMSLPMRFIMTTPTLHILDIFTLVSLTPVMILMCLPLLAHAAISLTMMR